MDSRVLHYKSYVRSIVMPKLIHLHDNLSCVAFSLMKLLPAKYMIEKAMREGAITSDTTVIETSSGTFALGLAMVCNDLNLKSIIVSDPVIDESLRRRLNDLGCEVDIVDTPCAVGGFQAARLNRLHEYLASGRKFFWTRQYDNPDNPRAYAAVAEDILDIMGVVDCVIGPVGSGGSMCGLLSAFTESLGSNVYGIAVDTNNSILFGQPDGNRVLRGLGNSIMPKNLSHHLFDEVHWIDAATAFHATRELHRKYSAFYGPTSGAAFSVAEWHSSVFNNQRTLVVFPDEGYRYLDTVYNDAWLAENNLCEFTAQPVKVSSPNEALLHKWAYMPWAHKRIDEVSS